MPESLIFNIGANTKGFQDQMAACTKALAGLGAATLVVREAVQGFAKAVDLGSRLTDLSQRTGETAGNLYLMERAFKACGVAAENVGPSINKLQKTIEDAAKGSDTANEAFLALGLNAGDLQGRLPIEQMQAVAERISQIEDPSQRAAAAIGIFGKSGGELLPILRNFNAEMVTAKENTGSMARILDESAAKLDAMGDQLEEFGEKRGQFWTGFSAETVNNINGWSAAWQRAFGKIETDAAGAGEVISQAIWNPALVLMRAEFKAMGMDVRTDMQKAVAAADPLREIAASFSTEIGKAVDSLRVGLGQSSLLKEMLKVPEMTWKRQPSATPYDAENWDPLGTVDFSDKNARTKGMARVDFMEHIDKAADELRKLRDSTDKLPEPLHGLRSGVEKLTETLPTLWDKHSPFSTAVVGQVTRKNTGTGAKFSGIFEPGKNTSGEAMNKGISAWGEYGSAEEFASGVMVPYDPETGLPMDDGKGRVSEAMAKAGKDGRHGQEDPVSSRLDRILDYLTKTMDPKIPQHILS